MTENEWLAKVQSAAETAEKARQKRDEVIVGAYADGDVAAAKIAKAVGMTPGRIFQIAQTAGRGRGTRRTA